MGLQQTAHVRCTSALSCSGGVWLGSAIAARAIGMMQCCQTECCGEVQFGCASHHASLRRTGSRTTLACSSTGCTLSTRTAASSDQGAITRASHHASLRRTDNRTTRQEDNPCMQARPVAHCVLAQLPAVTKGQLFETQTGKLRNAFFVGLNKVQVSASKPGTGSSSQHLNSGKDSRDLMCLAKTTDLVACPLIHRRCWHSSCVGTEPAARPRQHQHSPGALPCTGT